MYVHTAMRFVKWVYCLRFGQWMKSSLFLYIFYFISYLFVDVTYNTSAHSSLATTKSANIYDCFLGFVLQLGQLTLKWIFEFKKRKQANIWPSRCTAGQTTSWLYKYYKINLKETTIFYLPTGFPHAMRCDWLVFVIVQFCYCSCWCIINRHKPQPDITRLMQTQRRKERKIT